MKNITYSLFSLALAAALFTACSDDDASANNSNENTNKTFTIAVIPDTQNMTDFTHQSSYQVSEGIYFPIDASTQFYGMMEYIANNTVTRGGDIAFATSVGDIWQHQTEILDPEH